MKPRDPVRNAGEEKEEQQQEREREREKGRRGGGGGGGGGHSREIKFLCPTSYKFWTAATTQTHESVW